MYDQVLFFYFFREMGREYAIMESEEFKCPDEAVVISMYNNYVFILENVNI